MKTSSWCVALAVGMMVLAEMAVGAEIGTAFTYQGTLENGSGPVTDTCDFRFGLWRDASSVLPADQVAAPQSINSVEVAGGAFGVTLDFGASAIDGDARWLEIEVQCPGDGGFILLTPRVEMTPAPHALRASEGVGPPNMLEVDAVNGRIGIGTSAPLQPLHVVGAIYAENPGSTPLGSNVRLGAPSNDPGLVIERGNGAGGVQKRFDIAVESDNSLEFRDTTAAIDRMVIDTTGRVGIGTNAPGEQLTVAGTVHSTTGGFKFPDGSTQTTAAVGSSGNTLDQSYDEGGAGVGRIITADAGPLEIQGNDGLVVAGTIQSGNSIVVDGTAHTLRSDADFDIYVQGGRALRLETTATAPNIIGGYFGNLVSAGTTAATIAGGGSLHSDDGSGYRCDNNFLLCGRCSVSNSPCISDFSCPSGQTCQPQQSDCGPGAMCELNEPVICFGGPDDGDVCGICEGGASSGNLCLQEIDCFTGSSCVPNPAGCSSPGICGKNSGANRVYSLAGTIGGGVDNTVRGNAATVAGGFENQSSKTADTVGGGESNAARGGHSTVPGGTGNSAGGYCSFAAGCYAQVRDAVAAGNSDGDVGTFVWSDGTTVFTSTGPAQFLISALGGVGINTNAPTDPLTVNGVIRSLTGGFELPDGTILNDAADLGPGTINSLDASDGNPTDAVFVNSVGQVGIGTADADVVLEVNGGTELSLTDSTGWFMIGDQDSANLAFDTNEIQARSNAVAADLLLNPAGGNVAIRATTALAPLHIEGGTDSTVSGGGFVHIGGNAGLNISIDNNEILARDNGAVSSLGLNVDGGDVHMVVVSGDVGIGTNTPSAKLHVVGDIVYTGTITDISDERLKENIAPVENAISKIQQLRGVYFNMSDTPEKRDVGLIAQDVQVVLPEAVRVVDSEKGYLGVAYPSVIPLLVEAIKEQDSALAVKNCKIESLDSEISNLKSEIDELKSLVKALADRHNNGERQ